MAARSMKRVRAESVASDTANAHGQLHMKTAHPEKKAAIGKGLDKPDYETLFVTLMMLLGFKTDAKVRAEVEADCQFYLVHGREAWLKRALDAHLRDEGLTSVKAFMRRYDEEGCLDYFTSSSAEVRFYTEANLMAAYSMAKEQDRDDESDGDGDTVAKNPAANTQTLDEVPSSQDIIIDSRTREWVRR